MKKNLKIIMGICLILFIFILLLVVTNNSLFFDTKFYNFIISFRCDFLDNYFKLITIFGNPNIVIIILGFLVLFFRNKKGLILAISTFSSLTINSLVKHLIRRKRPTVIHLIKQGGYSFPSGHAMIAVCLYGYLLYLVQKNINNKILKIIFTAFLLVLIISIGLSRIYVGVHFVSDVVAGYLLSTILLILIIYESNKYLE